MRLQRFRLYTCTFALRPSRSTAQNTTMPAKVTFRVALFARTDLAFDVAVLQRPPGPDPSERPRGGFAFASRPMLM